MSQSLKTLLATFAAAAMVAAAIVGRSALDTKKESAAVRLTIACDPLAEAFCEAAKAADPRISLRIEGPDVTTKKLLELPDGARPDIQAWVTVGPWLQMADGKPDGQGLQRDVAFVASTPVVLVTKPSQNLGACGRPPAGCLPLPSNKTGMPSPRSSGLGLAGLAQIVLARTGTAAADLELSSIQSGPAASAIDALAPNTDPRAGLEQLNAKFSQANPLVTTKAAASKVPTDGRAEVITSEPAVRAVLQVGLLDLSARMPLSKDERGGEALAEAATKAGWDPAGDLKGGLPDAGVLAALQEAWPSP